jgi:hypothetical protein
MTEYGLGRLPQFDERSLGFQIRPLLAPQQITKPRSYTWRLDLRLNQGNTPRCVGFGWTHELAARPVVVPNLTAEIADSFYHQFQLNDEWPGEDYEGTSVLAGAKTLTALGWFTEYRWAYNVEDLALSIGYHGPAVLGVDWHSDMFEPDANGFVHATGAIEGGHCVIANGVSLKGQYFLITNSWGADWGNNGTAKLSFEDATMLLNNQGEACIPVGRKKAARFA